LRRDFSTFRSQHRHPASRFCPDLSRAPFAIVIIFSYLLAIITIEFSFGTDFCLDLVCVATVSVPAVN
jgi:hypothetical protein